MTRPVGPAGDIGALESGAPYTVLGRLNGYIPPPGTASVGDGSVSAPIDASGRYALHGLTAGAHTLKPQSAWAVFVPKTRNVNLVADAVAIDFISYRTNAITISRLGPGAVSAIYAGESGISYNVDLSTALPAWNPYLNLTADTDGVIRWAETNSSPATKRFFRVQRP
jgi:hypothetical protein